MGNTCEPWALESLMRQELSRKEGKRVLTEQHVHCLTKRCTETQ